MPLVRTGQLLSVVSKGFLAGSKFVSLLLNYGFVSNEWSSSQLVAHPSLTGCRRAARDPLVNHGSHDPEIPIPNT